MAEKIHFYAPAANHYISPTLLWSVARLSVKDGVKWLETQWAGGSGFQGMALNTSVPGAAIAAEVLNQSDSHSAWKMYPFSALNITEVMATTPPRKPEDNIMRVFGFSADDCKNIVMALTRYPHSEICPQCCVSALCENHTCRQRSPSLLRQYLVYRKGDVDRIFAGSEGR